MNCERCGDPVHLLWHQGHLFLATTNNGTICGVPYGLGPEDAALRDRGFPYHRLDLSSPSKVEEWLAS